MKDDTNDRNEMIEVGPSVGGLYNTLFGTNPIADVLLRTIGLDRSAFGRFRDAYVYQDMICVYTRNGDGNREKYQPVINALKFHPCFLRDADDLFDPTYCTIYFAIPDDLKVVLRVFAYTDDMVPEAVWRTMAANPDRMRERMMEGARAESGLQRLLDMFPKGGNDTEKVNR